MILILSNILVSLCCRRQVQGLDTGADDYLVKSFGVMEMVSRIKAVLRRCAPEEIDEVLRIGEIVLDDKKHAVSVAMVVLVASLFIASSFLYDYFNRSQVNQLKEELSLVAENIDKVGTEYFENFDSSIFRFTLVSSDGSVLYDSQAKAGEMENHLEREEISEALKDGSGSSARYSSTLTERTFYEANRLENGNVLHISVSRITVGALILGMLPAICAMEPSSLIVRLTKEPLLPCHSK